MTSNVPTPVAVDMLDSLLQLQPGTAEHALRHARGKVVSATQASHALFFAAEGHKLSLCERLWVAYYAAYLTPQAALAAHYLEHLQAEGLDSAVLASLHAGHLDALENVRLGAILTFTRTLIQSPRHGDQTALRALQQAGLGTEEVVVLAQLIAYLSYQVRLAAGLGALFATGDAA